MTDLAKQISNPTSSPVGSKLQDLISSSVDNIDTIISCSSHQKRIVDDILVLSKLDSNLLQILPSSVPVTSLLRDVEKMFEVEAQRNAITLRTEVHPSLTSLSVTNALLDPGRVQQVLINLTTNALKFCKKKPENQRIVTIHIGASKARPSSGDKDVLPNIDFVVAHSLHDSIYDTPEYSDQSFYLWFSVTDTGRGMSAEEKSRIFARFCQGSPRTETEYGGSRLGLFISRELSELQGGEIGVSSEPDVGSEFAFLIKTRHAEAPAALPLQPSVPVEAKDKQGQSKLGILVVEDNVVN